MALFKASMDNIFRLGGVAFEIGHEKRKSCRERSNGTADNPKNLSVSTVPYFPGVFLFLQRLMGKIFNVT